MQEQTMGRYHGQNSRPPWTRFRIDKGTTDKVVGRLGLDSEKTKVPRTKQ